MVYHIFLQNPVSRDALEPKTELRMQHFSLLSQFDRELLLPPPEHVKPRLPHYCFVLQYPKVFLSIKVFLSMVYFYLLTTGYHHRRAVLH